MKEIQGMDWKNKRMKGLFFRGENNYEIMRQRMTQSVRWILFDKKKKKKSRTIERVNEMSLMGLIDRKNRR